MAMPRLQQRLWAAGDSSAGMRYWTFPPLLTFEGVAGAHDWCRAIAQAPSVAPPGAGRCECNPAPAVWAPRAP
jgi:hypothetical protein